MKHEDDSQRRSLSRRLPFCHLSSQCVLYADKLDGFGHSNAEVSEDIREEQLVERLRMHILTCSTCQARLAEVRQQREVLREVLREGEHEVPSTASHIIATLRHEALSSTVTNASTSHTHTEGISGADEMLFVPLSQHPIEAPNRRQRRSRWIDILSVATAAAFVLASITVLGRFLFLRTTTTMHTSTPSQSTSAMAVPTLVPSSSWSSVVMTYTLANKTIIANYDPVSGQNAPLGTFTHVQVAVDEVAHSGYQVLYHTYDGTYTRYYLYPQTQQTIFMTSGYGGAAIWSGGDNDHYLFISTQQGIVQFDTTARTPRVLSSTVTAATHVLFSRDNYLYFVQSEGNKLTNDMGTLYRLDMRRNGATAEQITPCPQASNFWLNPVGTLIYYQCLSQNKNDLYVVNVDGSNAHLLRTNAGHIVGYTADNSLMVVQTAHEQYQIAQLGVNVQQDRIIIADIAPGAQLVRPADVAVAPYGYALVAKGIYANNVEHLWYGDLMTAGTQEVHLPNGAHNINLVGWDRLAVAS